MRAEDPDSRSLTLAALEVLDLPGVHETVKKKGKEGGAGGGRWSVQEANEKVEFVQFW